MAVNSQKSQQEKSRLKNLISKWNEAKEIEWEKIRYPAGEDFSDHAVFWNITNSIQDPIYTVQWEPP